MVPGRALHRIAKFLLPPQVCDQIVDAQLADFQHEWAQAPNALARALVLARGYLAFCAVFVSCAVGMRGLEVDERRALRRVFVIAGAGSLLAMIGLAVTFLGSMPQPAHLDPARLASWRRFRFVLFLNNASLILPLAVSIGLVCGIGIGLQRHAARSVKRAVLVATAALCIAMFAMSSWLLPSAFRSLSQVIRGQASAGQPAASTLSESRQAMVAVERTPTAGPGTIRSAQVRYYFAWAWPFAAFSLGLFALSLLHRGRVTRIVLGIAGCAAYFYIVRNVSQTLVWETKLPTVFVAWWPNILFVGLSMIIMVMSRTISRIKHA